MESDTKTLQKDVLIDSFWFIFPVFLFAKIKKRKKIYFLMFYSLLHTDNKYKMTYNMCFFIHFCVISWSSLRVYLIFVNVFNIHCATMPLFL